jgi:site-specific DNA-methyltransferase (adenine-specific)
MNEEKKRAVSLFTTDAPAHAELNWFSERTGIPSRQIRHGLSNRMIPAAADMKTIEAVFGISELELRLAMGVLSQEIVDLLSKNSEAVCATLPKLQGRDCPECPPKSFQTVLGELYQGDCLALMPNMPEESVDLIFADPPFNLKKLYPSGINDNLQQTEYIQWCEKWAEECVRLLKPGGSLFIWNLPKWNSYMSSFLNARLTFRHWIACDIKFSLPIRGRLYPSHYSLLYYCKGDKPKTFKPDRLQMPICPHCLGDLRDYGGYKHKMNPKGVNLPDVWTDIPPVRHAKYKKRVGANELSVKLLDRIIEMASEEGDVVFDPFGGSGTTYVTAELKNRKWIGCELDELNHIKDRFDDLEADRIYLRRIREDLNCLFSEKSIKQRSLVGLWTPQSVRQKKNAQAELLLNN